MKAKILIGKPGLDGHDRGLRAVAKALQVAGFEVIYSGLYQSPEDFVDKAISENVDVIGLSVMTGAYNVIFPRVMELLEEKGANNIPVFGGGIIPEEDVPELKKNGIKEIFLPGATLEEIVEFVKNLLNKRIA